MTTQDAHSHIFTHRHSYTMGNVGLIALASGTSTCDRKNRELDTTFGCKMATPPTEPQSTSHSGVQCSFLFCHGALITSFMAFWVTQHNKTISITLLEELLAVENQNFNPDVKLGSIESFPFGIDCIEKNVFQGR